MEQPSDVSKLKAKVLVFFIVFSNIVRANSCFVTSSYLFQQDFKLIVVRLTGYEHVYYYVIRWSPVTQQLPFIAQYGGHAALRNPRCFAECERCRD